MDILKILQHFNEELQILLTFENKNKFIEIIVLISTNIQASTKGIKNEFSRAKNLDVQVDLMLISNELKRLDNLKWFD